VYHAAKILPVGVLWCYLAVSLLRKGVELPWPFARAITPQPLDARSLQEADASPDPAS
jgi:hypothetical protein